MKNFLLLILLFPIFGFGQTSDLFFSEYAEGSANHKYLEIYNGTGSAVDLANYSISYSNNGCDVLGAFDTPNGITWPSGTMLANNAFYIIAHPLSDASILALANMTSTSLSNGDDVFGLIDGATGNVIIDIIGDLQGDPGTGWSVAGTANGTANHTLARKSSVCAGNATGLGSFGIDVATSEWIVNAQDDWTNLGMHTAVCAAGCNLTASGITSLTCNDNGTGALTADDYLTFNLNPTGSTLGTNYTVTVTSGTITPTTAAYGSATAFQLQNGSAGAGNVTITITDDSGSTCTIDQLITDPGVCSSAVPVITLTPASLTGFNHVVGTPSTEQTFTASGLSLTADLVLTAPADFQISLTTGTGFTNTISLVPTSGTVSNTTIYTRANAVTMGTLIGSIVGTSAGAINDTVAVSGYADNYIYYTNDQISTTDANGVADSMNVLVELTGVVYCMDFDGNTGYSITLIDGSEEGINLFAFADLPNYTNPIEGDSLRVFGKIGQFNGLLQVVPDSIELLAQGVSLISPVVVTTLNESTESQLIKMMNLTLVTPMATFATGSTNVNVTDGVSTFTLRIDNDTDLPGSPAPQGLFNVTGLGGQFDSSSPYTAGYQLFPCGTSSFEDVCTTPSNATTTTGTSTANAVATGVDYQWINCVGNTLITGATNQSFTAVVTGNYAVIVTDGACSDTSACVSLIGTSAGINENAILNSVSVYPNPVQDILTIKNTSGQVVSFVVVDMNGKEILKSTTVLNATTVSTSTWNQGVYFVKFSSINGEAILRVVK